MMNHSHYLHIYPLILLFILHIITSSPLPLAPHRIRYPLTSTPSKPLDHKYSTEQVFHQKQHASHHAVHTMQTVTNSDVNTYPQYNPITGASLYYPSELNLVFDIRTPTSTSFYDLVETSWNNGTMLFLEYALSDECPVRLYLGYPNATRQEITQDYWEQNDPWCLGQTLGYLATADPNIVLVTFEGLAIDSVYTPFGFALVNLTASSPPTVLPQNVNQSLSDWVTTFALQGNTEPLYSTNGSVLDSNYIVPSNEQSVISQLNNVQSYVVNVVGPTPTDPNWGFVLLIRLMATGSIRFMKYDPSLNIQFDTILVPAVSVPRPTSANLPNQGTVVGSVSVDPSGHLYVLVDILPYQRKIVANFHAGILNTPTGNTKPSILFVINRDTGSIMRADWVPFNIDLPFDYSISAGLSSQASDGGVIMVLNGIRYDTSTVGSVFHFVDYNLTNIATTPIVQSAFIDTYPQAISTACNQPYTSVFANAVTHLTDGRYAVAGYHGYQIIGPTQTAATGFVAIFDINQLHANNLTSELVWNLGVYGRDNSITVMAPSANGGLTFGMTLDGAVSPERNPALQYFHSAVFKTVPGWETQAKCDALSTSSWTLECSPQSCVTWCTSMTPNPTTNPLPSFTLQQSSSCAALSNSSTGTTSPPTTPGGGIIIPTTPPTPSNGGGGSDAAKGNNGDSSSSSSTPRSTQLGVGLGLGLGGGLCCLGLIAGICIGRHKRGYTSTRSDPQQEGGVPIGALPHARLEENMGEGEAEGNSV